MSYKVKAGNFEGPFDLLLELVSRQKVDIGSISLSDIINQYLAEIERLRTIDLDVASDFLYVAATLLTIKTESLLEIPHEARDDELAYLTPAEARDALIAQLITYKTYKNASIWFDERFAAEARYHARPFGPDAELLQATPDFLQGVSLDDLGFLAAGALGRRETFLLDAEHIAGKPIPVETYVNTLQERLRVSPMLHFSELVDDRTPHAIVVVTFLAVLELYKRSLIDIRQAEPFGDIEITALNAATTPDGTSEDGDAGEERTGKDE